MIELVEKLRRNGILFTQLFTQHNLHQKKQKLKKIDLATCVFSHNVTRIFLFYTIEKKHQDILHFNKYNMYKKTNVEIQKNHLYRMSTKTRHFELYNPTTENAESLKQWENELIIMNTFFESKIIQYI